LTTNKKYAIINISKEREVKDMEEIYDLMIDGGWDKKNLYNIKGERFDNVLIKFANKKGWFYDYKIKEIDFMGKKVLMIAFAYWNDADCEVKTELFTFTETEFYSIGQLIF
jgi:hypothetical protein